jgi:hypothetical protein
LSALKRDQYFSVLRRLASAQRVSRVLVLGGMHTRSAEALLAGIADAGGSANVLGIGQPIDAFRRFESALAGRVQCSYLRRFRPEDVAREIDRALNEIRRARNIDA